MLKKLALYGIGIYVLGLIFSGLTYAVMEFVPYFIAGMIITTPIYGAVRKHTGKGVKVRKSVIAISKGLSKLVKINKQSISVYLVLLIVVMNTHQYIGEVLFSTAKVGIVTIAVSFVLWEGTRFIVKKAKKVQMLSYGEAVKGAF